MTAPADRRAPVRPERADPAGVRAIDRCAQDRAARAAVAALGRLGERGLATGWVHGPRLDHLPRRPWPEVASMLLPVAEALAAVHAAGWVHGDVSAANVVVRPDGTGALVDLGCAAPVGAAGATGTPGFAAPEVRAGSPVTPAAEVWSLAAVASSATLGAVADLDAALSVAPASRPADLVAVLAAAADPRAAVTRDYGPPPPALPSTGLAPPPVSRWRPAVVLLGAAASGIGAAGATPAPGRACPPVEASLAGDADGDGCDSAASWSAGILTVALAPGASPERVAVGAAGDVVLLGDWNCDGRDTPATYRPSTGVLTLWEQWPSPGRPAPPARTERAAAGASARVVGGDCDRVVVTADQ